MIVQNYQKDVCYFKEYPCYSTTTHLSQHREKQFGNIALVPFTRNTYPKGALPKYFIDKYQSPHQMYWLEWTLEEIKPQVISKGQLRFNSKNSNSINQPNSTFSQNPNQKYRCLYIAKLGQLVHIKLVFNSDPEIVGICQDFLYTIGGNQLIVTQLWPQTVNSASKIKSESQVPPKQSQIIHNLDQGSQVLSLDFVYSETEGVICKVIYFHQKKGPYSQVYRKNQVIESSLINKMFDLSLKFKKNEPKPLFYQTLVPNILGIVIHNFTEFSLLNLTEMKLIEGTRTKFDEWQLNPHQPIIVKSTANEPQADYNDCLNIVIGQGENIEIFLYHINYRKDAFINSPKDNKKQPASDLLGYPIHMFTSGQFIDFLTSKLSHFTLIHLEKITHLQNFVLNTMGIIYLGYQKRTQINEEVISDEIPITGFIDYLKPYITHEILMQQNKIWKEYKLDILRESSEQRTKSNQKTLERLLIPGRYENEFIQKTLRLNIISDLQDYLQNSRESLPEIHQRLVFQWRNQYKFVEFVIYKSQILVIRKNSIGTLIEIQEDQFVQEKDLLAEQQVSYNQILSRGFSVHYDLEGDKYIDEENGIYHLKKSEEQTKLGNLTLSGKNYEDKLRSINAILENVGDETYSRQDRSGGNLPYFDEQQIGKFSAKYKQAKDKIFYLSTEHDVQSPPAHDQKYVEQSMISHIYQNQPANPQQNYLELHISILSLRVKDVLSNLLNTMKINYHSYYTHLSTPKNLNKNPVSLEQLQIMHLEHMYMVFVMEWILNVGTKYQLQNQYEFFGRDLVEEFVIDYMNRFGQKATQNGAGGNTVKFFKEDLQFHVNNVLSLMFRGLLKDVFPHQMHLKLDNFIQNNVLEADQIPQQDLTRIQIEKINRNSNIFLLMLLKKLQSQGRSSSFITDDLLRLLFDPLIFKPFNPNIKKFIPINKTFVYCILSMPIETEQKKTILASHMDKKEFLSLLLLIQLENNCYLSLEQGLEVEIYQSKKVDFNANIIRLSRQNCCIIEDLILTHYKQFLFPTETQIPKKIPQNIQSVISNPDFEKQVVGYNQRHCIKFIKNLFSSIEFRYLTAVLMHDRNNFQSEGNDSENEESQYEKKNIAETYRQLIEQVDLINETYGCSKGSKIDRAFKKFYSKIYHQQQKPQSSRSSIQEPRTHSQNYPEMTGLGFKLSKWELDIIEKLYKKHIKILRMEKKDSSQSISIIQQRLNLEYAMIKIFLFRIKLIIKQMPHLVETDKQNYAQILEICVQGLTESLNLFRKWMADLSSEEKDFISDDQLLQNLAEIDQMQNSRVWDKNIDELSSYETDSSDQQDWQILGYLITPRWLKLLSLTFMEDSSVGNQQSMFTNYHSIDDILMKMIVVVKTQNLKNEEAELRQFFGNERINSLISRNKHLKDLYEQEPELRRQSNQGNVGYQGGYRNGSLDGYQRSTGLISKNSFTQNYFGKNSFY